MCFEAHMVVGIVQFPVDSWTVGLNVWLVSALDLPSLASGPLHRPAHHIASSKPVNEFPSKMDNYSLMSSHRIHCLSYSVG